MSEEPYVSPCNAILNSVAEYHRCRRIPAPGSLRCWQHGGRRKAEPVPAKCGWCGEDCPPGHAYCCPACETRFLQRHCRPCLQELRDWPESHA